ncbi:hypothetical protein D3C87_1547570 [compost metagenome]
MNEVVEFTIELYAGGEGDDPAFGVGWVHSDFNDEVAGFAAGFVLVFEFDHRFLALVRVNLANDDLAGARHLVHREGGAQQVVGIRVIPVAQRAVAVGFAQFSAWVDCVFGFGAGHWRPEKQHAGI